MLNKSKCFIWCGDLDPSNHDPLGCGIPRADAGGLLLLGSPIRTPSFAQFEVDKRIQKIADIMQRLPSFKDPQSQFCLLRSCLSLPKLLYTLRTCNPAVLLPCYSCFDELQKLALEQILDWSLSDNAWSQSTLPASLGGLGLRLASSHSVAAFLSSTAQCTLLTDETLSKFPDQPSVDVAMDLFCTTTGRSAPLTDPEHNNFSQKSLSRIIDNRHQNNLLENASDICSSARLKSLTLSFAGAWLNVVPSRTLGLSLQPIHFQLACRYRLGLEVYPYPASSCPACGGPSDTLGDHPIICATEGEMIQCHDVLRDTIF
jgi:hypothetical protein